MKRISLILGFLIFMVFVAAVSNFESITLSGDLIVGDDVTVADDVTISGDVSAAAISGTTGTFTGAMVLGTTVSLDSAVSVGQNVFTTTAETDTVTISGATTGDFYIVSGVFTSAIDQQDILQVQAISGGLVVHRMASGESALKYNWIRFKDH